MTPINATRLFNSDVALAIFFLAERNAYAADRYLSLIEEKIGLLQENPHIAEPRPHLGEAIRKLSIPPYQLFYRVDKDHVTLLRLLHSSQRICQAMFGI